MVLVLLNYIIVLTGSCTFMHDAGWATCTIRGDAGSNLEWFVLSAVAVRAVDSHGRIHSYPAICTLRGVGGAHVQEAGPQLW